MHQTSNPNLEALVLLIPLLPLIGALIAGLFGKTIGKKGAHYVTCSLVGVSFFISVWLLYTQVSTTDGPFYFNLYTWGSSGGVSFNIGFLIDRLSALLLMVVSFVSWMVHIYTIGYMRDDSGYQRFFCYISLFTFGMLMLVSANNFLQLFFGWEMVGLMSYLLIGFWYERESAITANLKAFIVNRVGDCGFIIGIAAILYAFKSLDYLTVFNTMQSSSESITQLLPNNMMMTFICLGLLLGAMGKSAQIPLHVWLPDSMEGPTPISALIHAATMVTAGIFMIARMSPLFEHSELALNAILVIGGLTCFLMALVGIVQNDIKRIIAYSTLSQLGYMMMSLGASAYAVGIFHLMTHAFFKALLFLGAGAVIIMMHHEQNIWKMGNLKKYMPITYFTMLIGSLALIGFPFFSGFYSKDLIIESLALSHLSFSGFALVIAEITVFITALYSFRLFFVVFHTEERMSLEIKHHLKEAPAVMWVPLVILAICSIVAGFVFLAPLSHDFFLNAIKVLPEHDVLSKIFSNEIDTKPILFGLHGFETLPFWLGILGIFTAWLCYIAKPLLPSLIQYHLSLVYCILKDKFGFDRFYNAVVWHGTRLLGLLCFRFGDQLLIDGLGVNGTAKKIEASGALVSEFQTGYLYHYAFVMLTGFIILVVWLLLS